MVDDEGAAEREARRNYRCYFAASLAVNMAEGLFAMAMLVSVARATGSALSIGVGIALTTIPPLLFTPFQGAIIDRFDKARLAAWANALRGALIAVIAVALSLGYRGVGLIYGCALLCYVLWHFNVPVLESLLKVLLPGKVESRTAFVQGTWLVGMLGATIVAGLLIERAGLASAFFAALAVKLLGVAIFSRMRLSARGGGGLTGQPFSVALGRYVEELQAGRRYIVAERQLLPMVVAAAASLPFFQALNTLILPFASQALKTGPVSVGLIEGAAGLGSMLAALGCIWLTRRGLTGPALLVSEALLVGVVALFATATTVREASVGYFAIGVLGCNLRVLSKSLVLQMTQAEFSGRVMSIVSFISLAFSVLTSVLSGLIADHGLLEAYGFTAVFLLVPLAATLLWRARSREAARERERRESKPDAEV